jgi:hypothetical protein
VLTIQISRNGLLGPSQLTKAKLAMRITRLFRIAKIGAGASFQLDTKFQVFAEFFMPLAA